MLLPQMGCDRLLIEIVRFAALDGNRALRTMAQTRAEPVTQAVSNQPGLAVNDPDCPLLAGGDTETTAVALVLINPHDFANHGLPFLKATDGLSAGLILS